MPIRCLGGSFPTHVAALLLQSVGRAYLNMLGTNDFQSVHPHTSWHASQGIATLVAAIRQAPIEPGMPVPPVLVVVPPEIRSPKGSIAAKFAGAEKKCAGLARAFREVCSLLECPVFDAGSVTTSSRVDGIHLDADQHILLGKALAEVVVGMLQHLGSRVSTPPCDRLPYQPRSAA